jgi:uncharacterized membrane protein YgcG
MHMHLDSLRRRAAGALLSSSLALIVGGMAPLADAQQAAQPADNAAQPAAAAAQPAAELDTLEQLVGRVALYPDDLLSIVLPASTFPLQIVEADRWMQQNKGNKEAKPKESWDESVKALINYPDVVTMMSNDLDWTSAMGEAVAADQTAIMDAVQSFRRKAEGAGNLKTDDKQVVVVEEEVVKIVQADPQVIYVPQYEPTTVIVQQTVPYYPVYYPTPYPCYYYPYPPGYSFAAGFFWGATVAFAFDWYGGGIHNDVDIDINRNTNINTGDRNNINNRPTNVDRGQSQQMKAENRGSWQSKQSPSDVRQGRAPTASTRPAGGAGGAQATNRAAGATQGQRVPGSGAGAGTSASTRPSGGASTTNRSQPSTSASSRYNNTSRNASTARSSPPSKDAFSGMSSGRSVNAQSSRGSMSRGGGGFSGGGGRGGGGRR